MVADITRDGWLVTPKIDSLTTVGAQKSRYVPAGTVVMAVSGNIGLVSRLAVDACVHDGFVAFTRLKEHICIPEYLLALLHFSKTRHNNAKAGAIFINLTTTDIKSMSLPVPPVDLQLVYRERLQHLQAVTNVFVESASEQDALFISIQSRAFRGEL